MTQKSTPPAAVREAILTESLETLERSLTESPLAQELGIVFTEFEPGRATARLPASPKLPNFLGYTHTGAVFALAEQVMAAAANSLGYVGLPLNCEIHFLKGADPGEALEARARVVDTQGRIARVSVDVLQGATEVARVTEMVFLRTGGA
ncbi:MAG: PaaI family thioesterase [Deferrisomatales bacterium]|nr:PaaI family thioesterase [Deferrisomatales bacterium]